MGLGPRVVSTWPMGGHNGKTLIFLEIEVEYGKIHRVGDRFMFLSGRASHGVKGVGA